MVTVLMGQGPLGIGSTMLAAKDQLLERSVALIKLDPATLSAFNTAVELATQVALHPFACISV